MRYNKKKQPFTVMGRFHVQENGETVEYCRVRFHNTNKTQVVRNKLVAEGEFEDASIQSVEEIVEEIVEDFAPSTTQNLGLSFEEISGQVPMDEFEADMLSEDDLQSINVEDLVEPEVKSVAIIATNPDGNELEIDSSALAQLCELNYLDIEAVQACIDGDQKTHKKWKFRTV